MKKVNVLYLVQLAALVAVLLLMAFTPIGYLPIGPLKIALVTIPVVIGAMVLGPLAGLTLGIIFGLTSFSQCFGTDPFGTMLFSINGFFTFLMCVPTRALMGYLTGILFKTFRKMDRSKVWCYFVAGLCGAMLNTVFFMGVLILCFWNTAYIQSFASSAGAVGILGFLVAMVGLNGIVEWPCCAVIGGGVSKILSKVIRKTSDGEYVES